ncbi:nitrogen fixation NifU-like protein [Tumebacillus sp. BK434]|uniref:Fe-S cluster assembly sulfur transfer protein SufU n=1 Tax=Tumebacillus sp. BK434 TaxID=2512169 RepID=UPI0010532B10|nr:SUF system NifU family Fe-S cluster assembly protein [Tumebacillus sp. BK434]TCP55679.1 nitrogen fixation NifU-like protein [Tumebacillus sp. BK434]
MNLAELYRQVILDHAQHPRNFRAQDGAIRVKLKNPTCGDDVTLFLAVRDGNVQSASFQGTGCSISIASASLLTEAVQGQPLVAVLLLDEEFRKLVQGIPADTARLGDLEALAGVARFPARVKCATLAWNALLQAIEEGEGHPHE